MPNIFSINVTLFLRIAKISESLFFHESSFRYLSAFSASGLTDRHRLVLFRRPEKLYNVPGLPLCAKLYFIKRYYMTSTEELLSVPLEKVNRYIMSEMNSPVELVNSVCRHLILGGGKRIRPTLLLLSAGLISPDAVHDEKVMKLAAAIEILHTATLMHDDVIDESEMRRGRKSVNSLFGNSVAVLGGDYLFTKAFDLASVTESTEIFRDFFRAVSTIASGEIEQMGNIDHPELSEKTYYHTIYAKTGVLFEIAVRIPGFLFKVSEAQLQGLTDYGRYLGNAFQIADDILDYTSSADELGKNIGDDLHNHKITLPLIYILNALPDHEKQEALQAMETCNLDAIMNLAEKTGAISRCYKRAEQEAANARNALNIFPESPYRKQLLNLAEMAVKRTR